MKNILVINAHEYHPSSEARLNAALVDIAMSNLAEKGYQLRATTMKGDYSVGNLLFTCL